MKATTKCPKARKPYLKPSISSITIAAALAFLSSIGGRFAKYGTLGLGSMSSLIILAIKTIVIFLVLAIVVSALYNRWDTATETKYEQKNQEGRVPIKFFFICWMAIFCAWLVWIVPHWPGTVRDDTIAQYLQSSGLLRYYTQHPLFDTLCFGIFFNLGKTLGSTLQGLFIFIVVQALITSAVFAAIITFLKIARVPMPYLIVATCFYSLSRTIYQPIDSMSKDAWNGWAFALLTLLIVSSASKPYLLSSKRFVALYIAAAFFCIASKRSMLYVVVPAALLASLLMAAKKHCRRHAAVLACGIAAVALLFLFVWTPLSINALNAKETPSRELWSLPEQQIIATIKENPDVLSQHEYEELSTCCDYETAVKNYNPHRSDEVSWTLNDNASKLPLLKTWLKVLIRDPFTCIRAFFNMAGQWFTFNQSIDFGHNLQPDVFSEDHIKIWADLLDSSVQTAEAAISEFKVTASNGNMALAFVEQLDSIQQGIFTPLCSYGLYCTAIPLIVLAYGITRKNWGIVTLSAIPMLLLLSFLVGPIALYWYSIPAVYIAPLVMTLPYLFPNKKEASRS